MGQSAPKLPKAQLEEYQQGTKFTRDELEEWYAVFHENYPDGRMSQQQFVTENTAAHGGDSLLWEYMFQQLDSDQDGYIDFREFITSMSVGTRGDVSDKLRWTFKFYDKNKNGYIEFEEMLELFQSIFKLVEAIDIQNNVVPDQSLPLKRCQALFEKMDADKDNRLSIQEFIEGCKQDSTIMDVMQLKR